MLDLCGEHGIGAEIGVIFADQVNEAYECVLASDIYYRLVVVTSTMAEAHSSVRLDSLSLVFTGASP